MSHIAWISVEIKEISSSNMEAVSFARQSLIRLSALVNSVISTSSVDRKLFVKFPRVTLSEIFTLYKIKVNKRIIKNQVYCLLQSLSSFYVLLHFMGMSIMALHSFLTFVGIPTSPCSTIDLPIFYSLFLSARLVFNNFCDC